jgi:glutathione synthase/RimK-type ligase-like ATP-grasp enzyme
MKRVVLITGAEHYDASSQTSREPDDEALRQALLEKGIDVQVAVWNDVTIDWEHMVHGAIVVIRSCWDYHNNREGFLAWSERIASMSTLLNPVEILRWNTHKRYLQVLARQGIPTIPTVWLPRGKSLVLADLLVERRWSSAVIKPAVSTNAYATLFVDEASLAAGEAQAHLNTWAFEREMMIQPYIDAVREVGEHSLVFIAGEQTHAFRKRAVLCGEADSLGEHPIIPTSQEVHLAQKILRIAARLLGMCSYSSFLFARVDLIDDSGTLRLMELELVEPRLRLCGAPRCKELLVAAIAAHCVASHTQPLPLAS